MQERSQNFDEVGDESEVTLAAPRFDADEARRAHPVVPLEEIPAGRHAALGRALFRVGARRRWPLSLLAVALLAVVAFGGIVALRRAHTTTPAPVSADAAQNQQPPQTDTKTDTTPAQTAAAPTQSDASAQPQSAPAPAAAAEEKTDEGKSAGEEKSEARAPLRAREERASHARRDEEALPPPAPPVAERRDVDGDDGERGQHRGHSKGGDGRDEERGDRDLKK